MTAHVVATSADSTHRFSKIPVEEIRLLAGLGVEGDAHLGVTVQHRSRVARDPSQPNLRQVHLLHRELLDELVDQGFDVAPGQLGENITTVGLDLLGLPTGTVLQIGDDARIRVTGLRNPCVQINHFRRGMLKAVVQQDESGELVRRGGIMGVVLTSGSISPGDAISVELPAPPFTGLRPV